MSQINVTMDAQMQGFWQAAAKSYDRVKSLEGGVKELTRAMGRTTREVERFGRSSGESDKGLRELGASVGRMLTPLALAGAAWRALSAAIRETRAEQEQLAAGITTEEEGLKRLAQVADTRAERDALQAMAGRIAETGVMSRGQALEYVFQAKSLGALDVAESIAGTGRFTDPVAMIGAVGKLRAAFGPRETGAAEEIVSKIITAAKASDVSIEQLAPTLAIAAQSAARVGTSDEELMALLSVLSPAFKSPETAAQRIAGLATLLARPYEVGGRPADFRGGGILAGIEAFRAADPAQFQQAIAGSKEAAEALESIDKQRSAIAERLAAVTRAGATRAPLTAALALADLPELEALRAKRAEEARYQREGTELGLRQLEYEAEERRMRGEFAGPGAAPLLGSLFAAKYRAFATFAGPDVAADLIRADRAAFDEMTRRVGDPALQEALEREPELFLGLGPGARRRTIETRPQGLKAPHEYHSEAIENRR